MQTDRLLDDKKQQLKTSTYNRKQKTNSHLKSIT